jgi:hypothetical protein
LTLSHGCNTTYYKSEQQCIKTKTSMKSQFRKVLSISIVAGALLLGSFQSQSATLLGVDASKGWVGYMNVFNSAADGGGYLWGSPWGAADLPAVFSGGQLTLGPNINTYNATDPYWSKDGAGNKQLSANFYVENGSLAGAQMIFSGDVIANTLVSPYTSVAFIKEFTPSYSLVGQTTAPLTGGTPFSLNYTGTAGNIIQYGFETFGPNANPATAPSLGSVQITVVPEPTVLGLGSLGLISLALIRRKN